jgi:ABC-type sugar transport system permease subunit
MSKFRFRREAIEGYLFLLPNFLGFLIFSAVPLAVSFYYSFTDYNLLSSPKFVGLQNYIDALGITIKPERYQAALNHGKTWFDAVTSVVVAHDPTFWLSLGNTFKYAVGMLVLTVIPAFLVAWMLNSRLRGMSVFRTLFYIPVVASTVGIALVWLWIYMNPSGVLNIVITAIVQSLNSILSPLHVVVTDPNMTWLQDPDWALICLFIITAWATIGYDMVIFLAALQGIPRELFEAATVDGSTRWYTLRRIVIPLMSPAIFFVLVTNIIAVIQVFSEPYIMTLGGPANSTLTIVLYLYRIGFQRFRMGYACALAWIVFAITFIITQIQFRLARRWVYEE